MQETSEWALDAGGHTQKVRRLRPVVLQKETPSHARAPG